jgi:hypothetical protein
VTAGAVLYAVLALGVAGFHLAVILGAPWGSLTMGGRWPGVLPLRARLLSALSAGLILGMAAVLWRGGPPVALSGVVALSALAVLANAATPSAPERRLWLPVTIVMLVAALSVAL